MREEVEVLETHADLRPDLVDVLEVRGQNSPIDLNQTLLVLFQSVDAADQRGLTGTRRSADNNPFATINS